MALQDSSQRKLSRLEGSLVKQQWWKKKRRRKKTQEDSEGVKTDLTAAGYHSSAVSNSTALENTNTTICV